VHKSAQGRILALDVGRRRIGLAISDPLRITAQGLETFERKNLREDLARLVRLASEREVVLFLVGLPLHMSGHESAQSAYVRDFAARLSDASGVPVEFWDERLTTREAERALREGSATLKRKKRSVDRMAAVLLLESYLDSRAEEAPWEPPPA
jgi:putative Holliday junction resolvase